MKIKNLNKAFLCFQLNQYSYESLINKVANAIIKNDINTLYKGLKLKNINDISLTSVLEHIAYLKENHIICHQYGEYWDDNYIFYDPNNLAARLEYIMFYIYDKTINNQFDDIEQIINELLSVTIYCDNHDNYYDGSYESECYPIKELFYKCKVKYFSYEDYINIYRLFLDYLDKNKYINSLNDLLNKINDNYLCYDLNKEIHQLAAKYLIKLPVRDLH